MHEVDKLHYGPAPKLMFVDETVICVGCGCLWDIYLFGGRSVCISLKLRHFFESWNEHEHPWSFLKPALLTPTLSIQVIDPTCPRFNFSRSVGVVTDAESRATGAQVSLSSTTYIAFIGALSILKAVFVLLEAFGALEIKGERNFTRRYDGGKWYVRVVGQVRRAQ